MYSFQNDYNEGAHERILERLSAINREQIDPYGGDRYSEEARRLIQKELDRDCEVFFLVGGTQANATVMSAFLRPHQGVISAEIGHINVHEAGAIEATGHKVLALPSTNGKLTAHGIEACVAAHWDDPTRTHTVQPGLVYLSQPTEVGTLYSKGELEEISALCRRRGLALYLDGARMGCALTASENDLSLADLARLTDAFTIGGTKMGALFGEALVIGNPQLGRDFLYVVKQRGARLAKGWLLGVQFAELFRDGLYYTLAGHANQMAGRLAEGIQALSIPLLAPAVTNQIFPILPDKAIDALAEEYRFQVWETAGEGRHAIRLVTSWSTREEMVERFLADLGRIVKG